MTQHLAMEFWGNQAPIRLLMLFALIGYTYLFKPSEPSSPFAKGKIQAPTAGDSLKTGLVFTWAFLELGVWFLVYLSLKEERKQTVITRINRREAEI